MSYIRPMSIIAMILTILVLVTGIMALDNSESRGKFAFDFPKYIGGSLGAMVEDIGYVPEKFDASCLDMDGELSYGGYWFLYSPGIEIHVQFDRFISQPAGRKDRIHDYEYFRDEKIESLEIIFICGVGDIMR